MFCHCRKDGTVTIGKELFKNWLFVYCVLKNTIRQTVKTWITKENGKKLKQKLTTEMFSFSSFLDFLDFFFFIPLSPIWPTSSIVVAVVVSEYVSVTVF